MTNLSFGTSNLTDARFRVADADFSAESMLAQDNQGRQNVMKLLGN